MRDPYIDLAQVYDRFEGQVGVYLPQEVEFFRTLFKEHRVGKVLDCACGTGKHLPLFNTLGCQVSASDISPAMLAQAKINLAQAGLDLPLLEADYRQLPDHFTDPFDGVVCLSSSILHMPAEEELFNAFTSMRGVLRPGGILVLTQGTSDRQWAEKPRFILAVNEPDFSRMFVIDYKGQGACYNIVDIEHGKDRQGMQVWQMEYPRIWLQDDYQAMLTKAGFETIEFYGSFAFEPYSKQHSHRLITVAR